MDSRYKLTREREGKSVDSEVDEDHRNGGFQEFLVTKADKGDTGVIRSAEQVTRTEDRPDRRR